jgi:multiple antibiotic resistance protein
MSLISIAVVLFLIMDPLGNISSFLSLTKDLEPKKQNTVILREMLVALAAMIFFNYLGEVIFDVLELSETTVRISSGIILFLIAIKILFTAPDSLRANLPKGEPVVFPVAIPLIAGPGLLATIMLYAHMEPYQSIMIVAILLAWAASVVILYFAKPIKQYLGTNGLMAAERLVGMVLVLISIQRFLEGILLFWTSHPNPI